MHCLTVFTNILNTVVLFLLLVRHTKMDSQVAGSFVVADYVVFDLMLVVFVALGFCFAWTPGGQRFNAFPVSMSMSASCLSSVTMLSNPAEVKLTQCSRLVFKSKQRK